jgi:hypothetical protein
MAICLILSALGFKRVEYFVSLGYATSIATQAVVMSLIFHETIRGWALVQSALLLAYGLRLGSFLLFRAGAASFKQEQDINATRGAKVGGLMKPAIWISVSVLYVLMFLPALLSMSAQAHGRALPSLPAGGFPTTLAKWCSGSASGSRPSPPTRPRSPGDLAALASRVSNW